MGLNVGKDIINLLFATDTTTPETSCVRVADLSRAASFRVPGLNDADNITFRSAGCLTMFNHSQVIESVDDAFRRQKTSH